MADSFQQTNQLISLIYETAEDVELWPKLLDEYQSELEEINEDALTKSVDWLAPEESEEADRSTTEADLSEHLLRVQRINKRLDQAKHEAGSAKKVLDFLPVAVITVTASRDLVNLNAIARKIVEGGQFLTVDQGKVRADTREHTERLGGIVRAAFSNETASRCSFKMEANKDNAVVSVFAMCSASDESSGSRALCTLFITTNLWAEHVSTDSLRVIYQLTAAEARLAKLLVSGDSLAVIADRLGVSHNTVRNQLKSIFSKTGTNRQSELVGLILSTPNNTASPISEELDIQGAADTPLYDLMEHRSLPSGAVISFIEFGDPAGKPVLYFHEFVAWDWWSLYRNDDFKEAGVRFIVVLRPGYFRTDFYHDFSFKKWADHVGELADSLGIDEFYCLGFSTGGPYAAAVAHYLSARCRGLSVVSSISQLVSISELDSVKPAMSRLVYSFAKYTPRLYKKLFKGLISTAYSNESNYINGYVQQWSVYDQKLMQNARVEASFYQSFRRVIDSNATGLVNEAVLQTKAWGFSFEDITVPVQVWRGEMDRAVPVKHALELASLFPDQTHELANTGHLLIYEHWQQIIKNLIHSH